MALTLAFTDAFSGAVVPTAYLRLQGLQVDAANRYLSARVAVYWDAAAHGDGRGPVGVFDADLTAAYDAVVTAPPTADEVGTADLVLARVYAVLKTLAAAPDGRGNVFDLTQATDA